MKKTILLLLLFGFYSYSLYGQDIISELPVLSPQSPTTSDLGKYGEIQVNESTGIISPSIPLFEYDAGKMKIPLILNYSGNGVRVNQDPTWVGINWNINPGGLITRTVKDLPDELTPSDKRIYLSHEEIDDLGGAHEFVGTGSNQHANTNTEWFIKLKEITHQDVDSQSDIFNYNFLGYSGSFYLDKQNHVHLIKHDNELQIMFMFLDNNQSMFIIKTPNGDSYFFGGTNASESSRTITNNGSGSTVNLPYIQNSFYLYQISFLNGGFVSFHYDNYDTTSDWVKIGISESASISSNPILYPCSKTIKTLYSDVENLVKLNKITNSFNNQEVVFNCNLNGNHNNSHKLNNIELKGGTNLIKK